MDKEGGVLGSEARQGGAWEGVSAGGSAAKLGRAEGSQHEW